MNYDTVEEWKAAGSPEGTEETPVTIGSPVEPTPTPIDQTTPAQPSNESNPEQPVLNLPPRPQPADVSGIESTLGKEAAQKIAEHIDSVRQDIYNQQKEAAILSYQSQKIGQTQEAETGVPAFVTIARVTNEPGWQDLAKAYPSYLEQAKAIGIQDATGKLITVGTATANPQKIFATESIQKLEPYLREILFKQGTDAYTQAINQRIGAQSFALAQQRVSNNLEFAVQQIAQQVVINKQQSALDKLQDYVVPETINGIPTLTGVLRYDLVKFLKDKPASGEQILKDAQFSDKAIQAAKFYAAGGGRYSLDKPPGESKVPSPIKAIQSFVDNAQLSLDRWNDTWRKGVVDSAENRSVIIEQSLKGAGAVTAGLISFAPGLALMIGQAAVHPTNIPKQGLGLFNGIVGSARTSVDPIADPYDIAASVFNTGIIVGGLLSGGAALKGKISTAIKGGADYATLDASIEANHGNVFRFYNNNGLPDMADSYSAVVKTTKVYARDLLTVEKNTEYLKNKPLQSPFENDSVGQKVYDDYWNQVRADLKQAQSNLKITEAKFSDATKAYSDLLRKNTIGADDDLIAKQITSMPDYLKQDVRGLVKSIANPRDTVVIEQDLKLAKVKFEENVKDNPNDPAAWVTSANDVVKYQREYVVSKVQGENELYNQLITMRDQLDRLNKEIVESKSPTLTSLMNIAKVQLEESITETSRILQNSIYDMSREFKGDSDVIWKVENQVRELIDSQLQETVKQTGKPFIYNITPDEFKKLSPAEKVKLLQQAQTQDIKLLSTTKQPLLLKPITWQNVVDSVKRTMKPETVTQQRDFMSYASDFVEESGNKIERLIQILAEKKQDQFFRTHRLIGEERMNKYIEQGVLRERLEEMYGKEEIEQAFDVTPEEIDEIIKQVTRDNELKPTEKTSAQESMEANKKQVDIMEDFLKNNKVGNEDKLKTILKTLEETKRQVKVAERERVQQPLRETITEEQASKFVPAKIEEARPRPEPKIAEPKPGTVRSVFPGIRESTAPGSKPSYRPSTQPYIDVKAKSLVEELAKLGIFSQTTPQEFNQIEELIKTGLIAQTVGLTRNVTETQLANEVQSAIQQQLQQQIKTQTEQQIQTKPLTETQLQTLTQTITNIPAPIPPIAPIPPPPIPPTPPRFKLPTEETTKETLISPLSKAPISWKQGFVYYVIHYPYKTERDIEVRKKPPYGAMVVNGIGSAYKTIQGLGGNADVLLGIDMGIFDVRIDRPSARAGKPGSIRFTRDIKQRTTQELTVKGVKV